MATIRKRGEKWHVQVRMAGFPALTRSFSKKIDAESWARNTESDMERGKWRDQRPAQQISFPDVIDKYINDVCPGKKGAVQEKSRLKLFKDFPRFRKPLSAMDSSDVKAWVDMRSQAGADPMTVRRDVNLLSSVFKFCVRDLGYHGIDNPASANRVSLPKPLSTSQRDRVAAPNELDFIITHTGSMVLMAAVRLAVETAMRRSEIAGLLWDWVDIKTGVIALPDTKNGSSRDVPLSPAAITILKALRRESPSSRCVFASPRKAADGSEQPIRADAITRAWTRARDEAAKTRPEVADLRLHDLRHTATTALFQHEAKLNVLEVAAITGHKDLRSLQRYVHPEAEHLRARLGWTEPEAQDPPKAGKARKKRNG